MRRVNPFQLKWLICLQLSFSYCSNIEDKCLVLAPTHFSSILKKAVKARFCFLIPEDEDVEHRQIEWQTQHKLSNHHPGEDLIGGIVGYFAVVNCVVRRHVYMSRHNRGRSRLVSRAAEEVAVKVLFDIAPQQKKRRSIKGESSQASQG